MAKTNEDKKAKLEAKRAAAKAKKEAKKAARLEKKRKQAEAKKARLEAKKAKKLAKMEKEKARKAALKEKKRLAKEKQKAMQTAKTVKIAKPSIQKNASEIDIREASKTIKLAMAQIASQMAQYDDVKRAKKAKSIRWMGYDVETKDGEVIVRFDVEKSKKTVAQALDKSKTDVEKKPRVKKPVKKAVPLAVVEPDPLAIAEPEAVEEKPIEIPVGDTYGDQSIAGEVANLDGDDDAAIDDEDETIEEDDDTIPDSRDEQDADLVESRREFFGQYGDDFEPNDD